MKFLHGTLSAAAALAIAQLASAQGVSVSPNVSPSVSPSVEQQGAQNSSQVGSGNQSTQVYGNDNQSQSTQQSGTGNQQSQQYGSGNVNTQNGRTMINEHNRQYGNAGGGASAQGSQGDEERHDRGKHKGWSKNKNKERGDRD